MPLPSKINILKLLYKHPLYIRHLVSKKIRFYHRFRWIEQNPDKDSQVPPPLVYKFILTLKCNLRCKMCMLWGRVGWCKKEPAQVVSKELDWNMLKDTINRAAEFHPSFIFSGGEPLLYSHFEDLAKLLKEKRCFAYICTNGLLLDKFKYIISENPYLTFLVSLDGLKEENDLLRGKGIYEKVTDNIRLLKSLKNPPYIGIQFTIMPENVTNMYKFCKEMVKLDVDWILLNLCWFISEGQAKEYERFMFKDFNIIPRTHLGYLYPYHLDKEKFVSQFRKIRSEKWPIQISCYLKEPEDVYIYVDRPQIPPGNRFCYKQWLRMDVTPSGDATPCILFPDLTFDNLKEKSVLEIWNSTCYEKFRRKIRRGPLPVCSKCDALYLYDASRRYL